MDEKLTENQKKALSELRSLLENDIPSSVYEDTELLKRFLVAREYNAKKAESMLRKNLRWKRELQVENIITDFNAPEVIPKYFTITPLGHDKDGDPIEYLQFANLDEKGLMKAANAYQLRKYIVQVTEIDKRRTKPNGGGNCSKVLYIHNVGQVPFSRVLNRTVFPIMMKLVMEFQDNYPEIIKNLIVINVSPAFAVIWSVVKDWLGSSLMKKIIMYGEEGWKEELLNRIDADVLPAFLGGNRTDPDGNPLCLTTVNHGGLVPEEYYVEIDIDGFLQNPGATVAKIGRQKQLTVPIEVTDANCIINWEFFIKSDDIGFGLSLETSDDKRFEEIIPIHKIETERLPERGMYRCKSLGNYFILFDNSYSWIHGKEVFYRTWATSDY